MNRFTAIKNGNSVNVSLNGQNRVFSFDTEEELTDFITLCGNVKRGHSEALKQMQNWFDPTYRQPALSHLERDQAGRYYLKGYNMEMPQDLVEKIKEYIQLNFPVEALLEFWKLLMLNPDSRAREDLFKFADRFSFPITDKGYFIAYKSVAWAGKKHEDRGVLIAQKYVYEKANGRDPKLLKLVKWGESYQIWDEETFKNELEIAKQEWFEENNLENRLTELFPELISALAATSADMYEETVKRLAEERKVVAGTEEEWEKECPIEVISDLEEAFQNINELFDIEGPEFTDFRTKSMVIKLGEPVSMDREDCDSDPNQTCSSGLHVGAPGYVRNFGHRDAYIIACLVSPADVVAVPKDYSYEKMRCCKYYPYSICEFDENHNIKELDTQYFEADYAELEMEEIDKLLQENAAIAGEREMTEEEIEKNNLLTNRLIDLRAKG